MDGIQDTLADLMKRLAPREGVNQTRISQVKIFKASQYQARQPLCYKQGVIIVGQGTKRVFLGEKVYEYNPDNYLVLSVPLPAECETRATPKTPLLSMILDLDMTVIKEIISQMESGPGKSCTPPGSSKGLYLAQTTGQIKDACLRLLQALESPVESRIMGPAVIRELTFRIICGENGAALHALAMKNTTLSRVDKALKLIHGNYNIPMDVDQLAGLVHMSPSAFHRAFKGVTASSPIQYLKKIRLDKARTLIMDQGLRVNEAATRVGYESSTQFSREFKRYFGTTPVSFLPGRTQDSGISPSSP